MAVKAFSNLTTAEELKAYLDRPLSYMRYSVFHYTSLYVLLEIFSGKKLKFSQFDKTNDKIEADFVNDETKKKYFFCLLRSMEESFGMWAMYGGLTKGESSDALKNICVKIEFDVKQLRKFINEKKLKATAVAYTHIVGCKEGKKSIFSCGTVTNKNGISLQQNRDILSGYVKDNAWKYEREMRLWSESEFVDLTDEFIKSLKIIPSPVSSIEECENLIEKSKYKDMLESIRPQFVKNKYQGLYIEKK